MNKLTMILIASFSLLAKEGFVNKSFEFIDIENSQISVQLNS